MGCHELPRRRRRAKAVPGQHGQRTDILPHGCLVLGIECARSLHWNQGRPDIRNVSQVKHVKGYSETHNPRLGYAPYAAGLYTNNRFGTEWLVILGAALCGISAGVFWMAEAAIAIAYPEPWNQGKALGYWLTYRLAGQVLGGAINLGLNADKDEAGKVLYTVFLVFIALQASGPLVALLLNQPHQVERKDGKKVDLSILDNPGREILRTTKLFFSKQFLLIVLFIGQAVFAEAVFFTYLSRELPT